MKIREAELLREKSEWMGAQQQINQYIEGLHMEKDELIRTHTLETAELRKKNNILREAVEKLESQLKTSSNTTNFSLSAWPQKNGILMRSLPLQFCTRCTLDTYLSFVMRSM